MSAKPLLSMEILLKDPATITAFIVAKESMDKFFGMIKRGAAEIEDITKVVTSYEAACELDGIKPLTIEDFAFLPAADRNYHFNDHKAVIITRVLNQGWVPNWNDSNEEKWYIWFKWVGSGFSLLGVSFVLSYTRVGSRHHFKTEALARYAAGQFPEIFNQRMIS